MKAKEKVNVINENFKPTLYGVFVDTKFKGALFIQTEKEYIKLCEKYSKEEKKKKSTIKLEKI